GGRGVEGMIATAKYARENRVPYLGICLGMQVAVIEYARNALGYVDANSGEFDENSLHKVIDFLPGQSDLVDKGGTLRLGAYPCKIESGTMLEKCYSTTKISERHRHRYEFNNSFTDDFSNGDMIICGRSPDGKLVEAVEVKKHPFFIGVQFHPEFKSRPTNPHPLFVGLVSNSMKKL
ncbi:MAG: gamma-glutamyl-gamma-aminobutyrate hydrolase family protein, partial [Clostridia bacterium]|nr:gamma-glutamyl-gamma-aminobutyrate hydrolase family protein [Clostridia bacterium]